MLPLIYTCDMGQLGCYLTGLIITGHNDLTISIYTNRKLYVLDRDQPAPLSTFNELELYVRR